MSRTREEAFDFLIAQAEADNLGAQTDDGCAYEDRQGRHCVVGALLSEETLSMLREEDLLTTGIATVASKIGQRRTEMLLLRDCAPLSLVELIGLQATHDTIFNHYAGARAVNECVKVLRMFRDRGNVHQST